MQTKGELQGGAAKRMETHSGECRKAAFESCFKFWQK